jgi:endogenous inhibitor of DNA gyrase (YacG/DUF329 family)
MSTKLTKTHIDCPTCGRKVTVTYEHGGPPHTWDCPYPGCATKGALLDLTEMVLRAERGHV